MRDWPELDDAELLERLRLDDAAFQAYLERLAVLVPPGRAFDDAVLERALGYPWERPARSYLLRGGEVTLLEDVDPEARAAVRAGRHPLLAFGANGSPEGLERKLAHFPGAEDRTALVLAGQLEGFDVGPAAMTTLYGSLPATIFPSPGTRVRSSIVWVTAAQLRQLTWSEVSYRLGRLHGARFEPDDPDAGDLDGFCAFASRFGAFQPDGEPVALAAVPALGRSAAARTQRQLLDAVARIVLEPGASAEDLVHALMDRFSRIAPGIRDALRTHAVPLDDAHWLPFPGTAAG
ncbi:MAG: hypothetical protein QOE86_3966 [Solirubrobacteraceae bacterium]|nr:hypothetical protein [Solirubrobacteraceae bacterium]